MKILVKQLRERVCSYALYMPTFVVLGEISVQKGDKGHINPL